MEISASKLLVQNCSSQDSKANCLRVDLPSLTRIAGAFNVQTSASNFSCSAFDTYRKNKVMKGAYVCAKGQEKPGGAGTKPSSTSSGSKASGSSAAGHLDVNYPALIGGTSIMAGLLQLLL